MTLGTQRIPEINKAYCNSQLHNCYYGLIIKYGIVLNSRD